MTLPQAADFPSLYQIWCKNFDRRTNYGPKTKFKMAAAAILNWSSLAILNIAYSQLLTAYFTSPPYKISYHRLYPRLTFWNSRWLPSAILELLYHKTTHEAAIVLTLNASACNFVTERIRLCVCVCVREREKTNKLHLFAHPKWVNRFLYDFAQN